MKLAVHGLAFSPLARRQWCRAVQHRHAAHPLWSTPTNETRFKALGTTFRLLYFASNENTALLEARAIVGRPDPAKVSAFGWTTIRVNVNLDNVADLRGSAERTQVETTVQELTGDWMDYANRTSTSHDISSNPPAPTQRFGAALHSNTKCQGFLTPSAMNPLVANLVVFADRIAINEQALTISPV